MSEPSNKPNSNLAENNAKRLAVARERAAQLWCKDTTKHLVMEPALAEEIAKLIDDALSKTCCVYCNKQYDMREEGAPDAISEHIMTCVKSPLVKLVRQCQEVVAEFEPLISQAEKFREYFIMSPADKGTLVNGLIAALDELEKKSYEITARPLQETLLRPGSGDGEVPASPVESNEQGSHGGHSTQQHDPGGEPLHS